MIEINLFNRRGVTLIDECDADLVSFRWCLASGYARRTVASVKSKPYVVLHRIVLERILGRQLKPGELCDHMNGNTLDNRRENLRLAAKSQNMRNSKKRANSASPYKGVSFTKQNKKNPWRAEIRVNGKPIFLGYHQTPEKAYAAYCEAAKTYHKEFARFE